MHNVLNLLDIWVDGTNSILKVSHLASIHGCHFTSFSFPSANCKPSHFLVSDKITQYYNCKLLKQLLGKSFHNPPHNSMKLFNLIDLSFCFYLTQWANLILSHRHKIQMNIKGTRGGDFALINLPVVKSCNDGNDRNATFLLFIYTITCSILFPDKRRITQLLANKTCTDTSFSIGLTSALLYQIWQ